jgi:Uma2 family endonuclease
MVQSSILRPLTRGQWLPMTWDEFLTWSPDEGQSEWVDGEGIAYVSNSTRHGDLVVLVLELLGRYLRLFGLGKVFAENVILRLPSRPAGRMPDIMVIGRDHYRNIQSQWVDGPALMVIEFLSGDSETRDLVEKHAEYEQEGVLEYVVIDAREGSHEFHYFRLNEYGQYESVSPDAAGRFHSSALPGFWIDPTWFQREPLPDPDDLLFAIAPEAYAAWLQAKARGARLPQNE